MNKYQLTYPPIINLATQVYKEWESKKFNYSEFTAIAVESLKAIADLKICPIEVSHWMRINPLPNQLQQNSSNFFGDPPVTLHEDELFVIDAYFWMSKNTTIHDHAFSGAFCVMEGAIFQMCFSFEKTYKNNKNNLTLGHLEPTSIKWLANKNDVVPIYAGSTFIHSTTHLIFPTITLCVRTKNTPGFLQSNYMYPSFAYQGNIKHSLHFEMYKLLHNVSSDKCYEHIDFVFDSNDIDSIYLLMQYIVDNTLDNKFRYIESKIKKLDPSIRIPLFNSIENMYFCKYNIIAENSIHRDSQSLCKLLKLNLTVESISELILNAMPNRKPLDFLYQWLTIAGQEDAVFNPLLINMLKQCDVKSQ